LCPGSSTIVRPANGAFEVVDGDPTVVVVDDGEMLVVTGPVVVVVAIVEEVDRGSPEPEHPASVMTRHVITRPEPQVFTRNVGDSLRMPLVGL
jgi:hypothetical protein